MNSTAVGDVLENSVLEMFRTRSVYTAHRTVRTKLRHGRRNSDLVVTLRSSSGAYSALVECKNRFRHVDQAILFELEQYRRLAQAQAALLITSRGLTAGAVEALPGFPHLAHFTATDLQSAIETGALDETIPYLASARGNRPQWLEVIAGILRAFDSISRSMWLMDRERRTSAFYCRAGSELLRAQRFVIASGLACRHGSDLTLQTTSACSRDVQAFLRDVYASHPAYLADWIRQAWTANEELMQLEKDNSGFVAPWQTSMIRFSERSLRLAQGLLLADADNAPLPSFEHGGLDGVLAVLKSLPQIEGLISQILFERLALESDANTKTVAAHIGRRFMPFRRLISEELQLEWADVQRLAVNSTIGDDLARLNVQHDVAYCGAMFGDSAQMREDIESIAADRPRMTALVEMNLRIGAQNPTRLLAMLRRKSEIPPPGEEFVKTWAGVIHKRVYAAAKAQRLL